MTDLMQLQPQRMYCTIGKARTARLDFHSSDLRVYKRKISRVPIYSYFLWPSWLVTLPPFMRSGVQNPRLHWSLEKAHAKMSID